MTTKKETEESKGDFPRFVYKKGTGRKVNEQGLYEADGIRVHDAQQLADLGADYVATPKEATTENKAEKK